MKEGYLLPRGLRVKMGALIVRITYNNTFIIETKLLLL